MTTALNIGMIGYGFMGRAHSKRLSAGQQLLRLEVPPRPQGRLRPQRRQDQRLRRHLGLRVDRNRLAEAPRTQGHRCRRHLRAEQPAQGDRPRRRGCREDDPLREAPLDEHQRGGGDVHGRRKGRVVNTVWYNYRRVPAVTLAKNLIAEGRLGKNSSTTAPTSFRTGRSRRTSRRGEPPSGGSTSRRPGRASRATCWPTASTPPSGSTAASRTSPP